MTLRRESTLKVGYNYLQLCAENMPVSADLRTYTHGFSVDHPRICVSSEL